MALEILAVIVFLNVMATPILWRTAARRPGKLRKKFYRQLLYSEPITPKHQPPPPLKEDTWGVTKEVRQFFNDFEDFADVIASYLLPGKFRGWMAERRIANPPHNPKSPLSASRDSDQKRQG